MKVSQYNGAYIHLSNIWSWIHDKVKQYWESVEKRRYLLKKGIFYVCPTKAATGGVV